MNLQYDNTDNKIEVDNSHFSLEDRKVISNMLKAQRSGVHITLLLIAVAVGATKGAIHKEIIKNGKLKAVGSRISSKNILSNYKNYKYSANQAHKKYMKRFCSVKYISKYKFSLEWINQNIEHHRSIYEMQQLFIDANPTEHCPSVPTLYYYWHKGIIKYKSTRKPRKWKPKKNKWLIDESKRSIDERPKIVESNTEFGHWEVDTVIDGDKKGGVVTFNERITKQYFCVRVEDKRAHTAFMAIRGLIKSIGIENIKTITSDNGTEFASHKKIENEFNINWYFCHPYCSGERGLNEHLNGELRFFIPKGGSFFNKKQCQIDIIYSQINNKIRKSLGGHTSNEIYNLYVDNSK